MPAHSRFGPDWYCQAHSATFEPHEADQNDGCCPWCGDPVGEDD